MSLSKTLLEHFNSSQATSSALSAAVQWLEQIRDCAELASSRDLGEMAESALNEIDKLRNKST